MHIFTVCIKRTEWNFVVLFNAQCISGIMNGPTLSDGRYRYSSHWFLLNPNFWCKENKLFTSRHLRAGAVYTGFYCVKSWLPRNHSMSSIIWHIYFPALWPRSDGLQSGQVTAPQSRRQCTEGCVQRALVPGNWQLFIWLQVEILNEFLTRFICFKPKMARFSALGKTDAQLHNPNSVDHL